MYSTKFRSRDLPPTCPPFAPYLPLHVFGKLPVARLAPHLPPHVFGHIPVARLAPPTGPLLPPQLMCTKMLFGGYALVSYIFTLCYVSLASGETPMLK